jgi:hypothetical protein
MNYHRLLLLTLMVFVLSFGVAAAQDTPATTEEPSGGEAVVTGPSIASGLNNPRHIFFADDGTLYIAEAGQGGDVDAQGPFGPVKAGQTAQISAVAPDGTLSVAIPELVSMDAGFGQIEGPGDVLVTEDSYWVVLGMGTQEPIVEGALAEAVVQIDKASGDVLQTIDLGAFETENNPDTGREVVSNPVDVALAEDGTLYIADASGNSVFTWNEADGLNLFVSWQVNDDTTQPVPTSIDIGPDGDIYIGFLSGYPYLPGSARIERYATDGTLEETYDGLTYVTDLLVTDDGTVYAVEMANGYGDTGFFANSGRVVKLVGGDIGVVLDGLNYPYGLAQSPTGELFVTVDSAFLAPGSGRVIPVGGM